MDLLINARFILNNLLLFLAFVVCEAARAELTWRKSNACIYRRAVYEVFSFRLQGEPYRYRLGRYTAETYFLLREHPEQRDCDYVEVKRSEIRRDGRDLLIGIESETIRVMNQQQVEWQNESLRRGEVESSTRFFSDISQSVLRFGNCSGFFVQASLPCLKEKRQFVSANHYPERPYAQEWIPRLNEGERLFPPGGTILLGDFRHNFEGNRLRIENTRKSECEDIQVADSDRTPIYVQPLALANRLPRVGEKVFIRGFANTDRPVELECSYNGVKDKMVVISRGLSRNVRFSVMHDLTCVYRVFGNEDLNSFLGGMSGGPALVKTDDGKEAVFGVLTTAALIGPDPNRRQYPIGTEVTFQVSAATMNASNQNCENGIHPLLA